MISSRSPGRPTIFGRQTLWRRVPGAEAMAAVGGKITLQAKEALALINGSTFSTAIATLVVRDAK